MNYIDLKNPKLKYTILFFNFNQTIFPF